MFDVAIIGAGPAGLSAAINLKLHNKKVVWFGCADFSDKIKRAPSIINYPGLGRITGRSLSQRFLAHANDLDLEIIDEFVVAVVPTGNEFVVNAGEKLYEAKKVLFTTGSSSEYSVPGEQEFLGAGVHSCASCDGHLYNGKEIAIFCEEEEFEQEVYFLAETVGKIYLYTPYHSNISLPNVVKITYPIVRVLGDQCAKSILLSDGSKIDIDGIFFIRKVVAPSVMLNNLSMDGPHISINRFCETNIPGVYAAGDCTGRPYQIAKAIGEGNIAAYRILEHLKK